MRRSTLLWLFLAALCSTFLFHTSQKVHDEREKLAALNVSVGQEEESLRVLNAEWGYLNQPARMEKLAAAYLDMAPLTGRQFIRIEDIPLRSAAPDVTAAAEKPAVKKIMPYRIAAAATPKPVIKIHKPVTAAFLRKPARTHSPAAAANNSRSFSDVMKNLGVGIE